MKKQVSDDFREAARTDEQRRKEFGGSVERILSAPKSERKKIIKQEADRLNRLG